MSRALRRDWSWLAEWTWASPKVPILVGTAAQRAHRLRPAQEIYRDREHDYALDPDPSTIGGCIRRGFLESA